MSNTFGSTAALSGVPPYGAGESNPNANAGQLQTYQQIAYLAQNHPWMPASTTLGLATAGYSPTTLATVANSLQSAYAAAGQGLNYIYGDPVLQKQPSLMTSIRQYMQSTIGPPPVAVDHINQIQQQLQAKGFGSDLPVGLWTPAWGGAWSQYKNYVTQNQLAGNRPGGKSAGGVLHMLTAILPKEAGNAIIGFAKALPHEIRQLSADFLGGLTNTVTGHWYNPGASAPGSKIGGTVAGQTPEQFAGPAGPHWGRTFDDISTVLLLSSLASTGAKVAGKIAVSQAAGPGTFSQGLRYLSGPGGLEAANELGLQEAYRGPGVVANTIGRGADLAGAGLSKIADAPFLNNIPALERLGPWVGKLNDADGLYYRLRTMAALPYEYRPIQAAGQIAQAGMVAGAEIRGTAAISGALSDKQSELSRSVQGTHTLDAVDGILKKNKVFGVSPSLDDLAFVLHAPETGFASKLVEGQGNAVVHAYDDMLGKVGIAGIAERATGKTIPELMKLGGVETPEQELVFRKYITAKVNDFAARYAGQREAFQMAATMPDAPAVGSPDWVRKIAWPAQSAILNDPEKLAQAREALLGDPDQLTQMWRKQITDSTIRGENELTPGLKQYLAASQHLTTNILPFRDSHLISDISSANQRTAMEFARMKQDGGVLDSTWGDGNPALDPGAGPKPQIGIARNETVTKDQALQAAKTFNQRLQDMGPNPTQAAHNALDDDLRTYMLKTFGIDARRAPHDTLGLIKAVEDNAQLLASPVWVNADGAPQRLLDSLQALRDMGYKPVVGQDIGWMHQDIPTLDVADGPLTWRRRMIDHLGLDPARQAPMTIGMARRNGMRQELQALVDSGKITMPAYYNVDTILSDLMDKNLLGNRGNPIVRGVQEAMGGIREGDKEATTGLVTARNSTLSRADLQRLINAQALDEANAGLGLGSLRRSDALNILTRTDALPTSTEAKAMYDTELAGHPELQIPLFSRDDANQIYRAIIRGSGKGVSGYQVGAAKLEDMMRGGFGFLGDRLPGEMGERIANMPNAYVQLRNELRFRLNPELSLRRITKTNAQLAVNDVTPTFRPAAAMRQAGTYDQDVAKLKDLLPNTLPGATDSAEQVLKNNDIFHLYNHDDYMAYAAGQWARQGLSDDQIRERLVRVFDYGSYTGGQVGRSAAERTVNFFFFPFSFDKKLYRNMGAYLLDHPGQTLLLDHALTAYKTFTEQHPNNPLSGKWLTDHAPILQEAQRLNAFAHGISAGQFGPFGALNAPVMNAFLPQLWQIRNPDEAGQAATNIQNFIPALKFIQNTLYDYTAKSGQLGGKYGNAQAKIIGTGIGNQWDKIFGAKPPTTIGGVQFANIREYNATNSAQFQEGNKIYQQATQTFQPWLKWNETHKGSLAYKLPMDPKFGKYAGKTFDATLLRDIIHSRYPGFDPTLAAEYAVTNQEKVRQYMYSVQGTPNGQLITNILNAAQSLSKGLQTGKLDLTGSGRAVPYTPQARAAIQDSIRGQAVQLAEQDPKFKTIWDKYFAGLYGPLEGAA